MGERRAARIARTAALAAITTTARAAVLHVHFGYAVHDVLGVVQRRKLPLVLSLHGDDATALPHQRPGFYDPVVDAVDALVVPSRWLADRAADLGFDPARTHVIPAGVDTALFTPSPLPDGPPIVAFVGRFVDKKGLDTLLAAWPSVLEAVPDAQLRVLGDGPGAALLDDTVRPRGVVHVPPDPSRRHEQVRDHLRSATVVASPSRTAFDGDAESLLLVNLEAQACGRAVVTTRHGGIPEFVAEGTTALVVTEGDVPELAGALINVLSDHDLAVRLGEAGPAQAARFDVARCSARVDAVYDDLVARGR
jgi:glycosyltransferase involved in cell wall biosynthesis